MPPTDTIPNLDPEPTTILPIYTKRAHEPFPSTPTDAYFSDREATEAAKAKLEATVTDPEAQIIAIRDPLCGRSCKIASCFIILVVSLVLSWITYSAFESDEAAFLWWFITLG
jgi:hypothetical protein